MRTPSLPAALGAIRAPGDLRGRGLAGALLVVAVVASLLQVEWEDGLLRSGGLPVLADVVGGLLRPDLSPTVLGGAVLAAWTTTAYAVAGMTLAVALGLPLAVIASGVLLAPGRRGRGGVALGRGLLAALRAVHELVWAWLFVAALGITPLAAILAIALPYAGVLGRIWADLLQDVPEGPLRALRAAGGDEALAFLWGRLPMAAPDMVAYGFYRFECALRSSAIMGFVGLGGLGLQIQLAVADLRFGAVGSHLLVLVAMIAVVEGWSGLVRGELTR